MPSNPLPVPGGNRTPEWLTGFLEQNPEELWSQGSPCPTSLQATAERKGALLAWDWEGSSSHLLVLIAVLWGWIW